LPGQLATSLRPKLASPLSSQESCQATRSDPDPNQKTQQQMFYSRVKERVSKHDLWLGRIRVRECIGILPKETVAFGSPE